MKQFSKILLLALGFGLLAVVLSSLPSHQTVAAPVTPVTPSLPVAVTNTPSVNVANTPEVSVNNFPAFPSTLTGTTVPVSGSVVLSGAPTISFSNTSSTPLYVDTDRAARESFFALSVAGAGATPQATNFPIPSTSDTVMVIESLSIECVVNTGSTPYQLYLGSQTPEGGVNGSQLFYPPIFKAFSNGSSDTYLWSGRVDQYANPQFAPYLVYSTSDNAVGEFCEGALTGHLVHP